MPRIMYDSTRAANIKRHITNPLMVAGYVDEYSIPKWSPNEWNSFKGVPQVRVAKKATTNDGHVLDVEPKLATPDQAPSWARMRRASGFKYPTIYCNRSTWPLVKAAFDRAGEPQPLYWIATGTGKAEIPTGAIAAQYALDVSPGPVDISIVADYWPGVDPEPHTDVTTGVDMTGVKPEALPYSFSVPNPDDSNPGWAFNYYPIEVGDSSVIIARQWMVLTSAWGSTDYEIIIVGPGQTLIAPASGSSPTKGVIPDRGRVFWEFTSGTVGVAVKWKDNGSDWSRTGISFPFKSK